MRVGPGADFSFYLSCGPRSVWNVHRVPPTRASTRWPSADIYLKPRASTDLILASALSR